MYVNPNWNDAQKSRQGKRKPKVRIFWMGSNLNKIFANDAWAKMSLNDLK